MGCLVGHAITSNALMTQNGATLGPLLSLLQTYALQIPRVGGATLLNSTLIWPSLLFYKLPNTVLELSLYLSKECPV
jgi:hypothetical protein